MRKKFSQFKNIIKKSFLKQSKSLQNTRKPSHPAIHDGINDVVSLTDVNNNDQAYNESTNSLIEDTSSFLENDSSTNFQSDLNEKSKSIESDESIFSNIFSSNKSSKIKLKQNNNMASSRIEFMQMSLKELIEFDDCFDQVYTDENFINMNTKEISKPTNMKDYNREGWLVSKLVKYLKNGNPTATYISLAILRDLDLNRDSVLYFLINSSVILVLVNLLATSDIKCQTGSLQILKELSSNNRMSFEIIKEGGIIPMIEILNDLDHDAKCLAAECLANLSVHKIARTIIRKQDGINRLIKLLGFTFISIKQINHTRQMKRMNVFKNIKTSNMNTNLDFSKNFEIMQSASNALYAMSRDCINHYIMLKHGIIILLSSILKTISNEKAIYWLIALLDNCTVTVEYINGLMSENLVSPLIRRLYETTDYTFKTHIIGIFSKCANNVQFCNILKSSKCFNFICKLAEDAIDKLPVLSAASIPPIIQSFDRENSLKQQEVDISFDYNVEKPNEKEKTLTY